MIVRACTCCLFFVFATFSPAIFFAGPQHTRSAEDRGGEYDIKVPAGFVVERIAEPPLVEHPIMASFDDEGRLWVAESSGRNLRAKQILDELPNSIRVLEDTDGDGKFDKAATFADKVGFAMGALWHEGAFYTAAAPSFWKFEDSKGRRGLEARADKRTPLATGFRFTGNAADVHGPFLGPDGRLYWTDGRHGHEIRQPDGSTLSGRAAYIFRCKTDGTELERVCGGGFDDPVEIAFTPEGEPFATVDILINKPRRVDAIIYCIEGGYYPWKQDVLNEFKKTGDLLPAVAEIGWVAPAALMRYRSSAFGKDFRNNLFVTEFNTHKVKRHIVVRDGATFRTQALEFLTSTNPDFHPTDVLEDADGSLIVIDTGGWFRNGCPTSQIAKPEIKGAIYRIRRVGAPKNNDPWGRKIAWSRLKPEELANLLDDPRWVVRDRAIRTLARRGDDAIPVLKAVLQGENKTVQARRNAVWTLTRIETSQARNTARSGLRDASDSVRLAAAHSVGLHRDQGAVETLMSMVIKDQPALRRQAALALGRIRDARAVPALFDSIRAGGDRFVEHAVIFALIRIADRKATLAGLRDANPNVRRVALIALDQMDGGNLQREMVAPLLDTSDVRLQKTAMGIISSRPGWAKEIVGLVGQWLQQPKLDSSRQESLRGAILAFGSEPAIQSLIAAKLEDPATPETAKLLLLETVARLPVDQSKPAWVRSLRSNLLSKQSNLVRQTVATLATLDIADFDDQLLALALDASQPIDLRVSAAKTIARRLRKVDEKLFRLLLDQLQDRTPPLVRLAAAEALGSSRLNDDQLIALAKVIARSAALELPRLLTAFATSKSERVGMELVAALDRAPGLMGISPQALERIVRMYPKTVQDSAVRLFEKLQVDSEKQKALLASLKGILSTGVKERGRAVFFSQKAACTTCHAVDGQGGRIGPDLSKIGSIRTPEDLLEAIVVPSASFVRGYEPFVVETAAGRVYNGIILRETADAIFLMTPERAEVRVPRDQIESLSPARDSIMPKGLDQQMSRQELADLIAYLKSLK
ncbi:MAG: glucose dehydrogenase [Gemmatales bacterium]|nr:MAG: glucose dehydrogenase [Gemmatales bacterium]